jgi:hypothetical protein
LQKEKPVESTGFSFMATRKDVSPMVAELLGFDGLGSLVDNLVGSFADSGGGVADGVRSLLNGGSGGIDGRFGSRSGFGGRRDFSRRFDGRRGRFHSRRFFGDRSGSFFFRAASGNGEGQKGGGKEGVLHVAVSSLAGESES